MSGKKHHYSYTESQRMVQGKKKNYLTFQFGKLHVVAPRCNVFELLNRK